MLVICPEQDGSGGHSSAAGEELGGLPCRRVQEEVSRNREKDYILMQQSRQAAMGEMIGNIAHQWRQSLNAVGLIIQDLADSYAYGDLTKEYFDETVSRGCGEVKNECN